MPSFARTVLSFTAGSRQNRHAGSAEGIRHAQASQIRSGAEHLLHESWAASEKAGECAHAIGGKVARQKPPRQHFTPSLEMRVRLVVRRLPPALPREAFIKSIEAFSGQCEDFEYVIGDERCSRHRLRSNRLMFLHSLGEHCYARAYLTFKTTDIAAAFSRAYDGHRFRNAQGLN